MEAGLTLGSLFDGIGGFCYAAQLTGRITPIWAAEIEGASDPGDRTGWEGASGG